MNLIGTTGMHGLYFKYERHINNYFDKFAVDSKVRFTNTIVKAYL